MKNYMMAVSCLAISAAMPAFAGEWAVDTGLSTLVTERGEQLGAESVLAELVYELDDGAYLGVYRLTQFGSDQSAFEDEFHYFFGYTFGIADVDVDLAAAYLTFPGGHSDGFLELVGIFSYEAPLNPEVVVFFNTDSEDYGAELVLTREAELSVNWTGAASLYGGFANAGHYGGSDRSYVGARVSASRPLSERSEFYAYAMAEGADDPTYLDGDTSSMGVGIGISFTFGE